jgi:hypothetical protein
MIRKEALLADYHSGTNAEEAKELKWWILRFIDEKKLVNADDIYKESRCGDTAMYLALHELVIDGLIEGTSPYEEKLEGTKHTEWLYRQAMNGVAMVHYQTAEALSQHWDPDKWAVNHTAEGK